MVKFADNTKMRNGVTGTVTDADGPASRVIVFVNDRSHVI